LGAYKDHDVLVKKYGISGLLISFNHKNPNKMHELKKFCRENDLRLKQFSIHVEHVNLES
jgi:hypothetical protein